MRQCRFVANEVLIMTAPSLISPRRRLGHWIDAYEAALAVSDCCDIADFLPPRSDRVYLPVLVELVRIFIERGWRSGQYPSLSDILQRFPEIADAPEALSAIAFEEYRQRLLRSEQVTVFEYTERYGVRVAAWPTMQQEPAALLNDANASAEENDGTDTAVPHVGQELAGYQLVAELGRGAFARVFLARQPDLANRLVVLKVSNRFPGESQSLAQLQHTNIVPIYSQHRVGNLHVLCMPYFGSSTLADALHELRAAGEAPTSGAGLASTIRNSIAATTAVTTLSRDTVASAHQSLGESLRRPTHARLLEQFSHIEAVLWLFSRIAQGLEHAHQRGVLHRDLKPANVLLRDDGEPMLLDFNLAGDRTSTAKSASTAVIGGTLPYMAPEQIRALLGEPVAVDIAADLFSLGVMIYELLTGRLPFASVAAATDSGLREALATRASIPPSMALLNREVTPAVEAIVSKCLAEVPAKRYASASDLAEDLRRQLDHLPLLHAANTSLGEGWRKWRRRHPRAISATAVTCVAAAVVMVFSVFWWRAERQVARNRANETLAHFFDQSLDAQFMLSATDPSSPERTRGRGLATQALAAFEANANADLLEADDRARLNSELADLNAALAADAGRAKERAKDALPEPQSVPDVVEIPASAHECFREAQLYYAAGRFSDAVALLEAAARLQPQQVRYWMLRGRAEEAQLHHDDAVTCFTACIVLKPDWAPAYVHRGTARFQQQKYADACVDFDAAVNLDPAFSAAYVNRALAKQQLGKLPEALADLDRAVELEPERTRFLHLRARLHRRAGNLASAEGDEQAAMSREPHDAEGWVARGVYLLPDHPKLALAAFEAANRLDPRSLEAMRNRAHVLAEYLHLPDRGIDVLAEAIRLYPDCAPAILGRGVLLARQGRRDQALADARLGLKYDQGAMAHYQAACIFAQTSRIIRTDADEAIRLLFVALHLGFDRAMAGRDPDLSPIRDHRDFLRLVPVAKSTAQAK